MIGLYIKGYKKLLQPKFDFVFGVFFRYQVQ